MNLFQSNRFIALSLLLTVLGNAVAFASELNGYQLAQNNLPPLDSGYPAYNPSGGNTNSGYGNPYQNSGYQQTPLQGRVVTAPAGTNLSASVNTPISSEYARVGDRFNLTLGGDLSSGGGLVLPAGSQLEAQVVSVVQAGHGGRNGQLDIRLTSATLPNGQRVSLSGRLQTEDGTGIIKGGSTAGRVGRAALTTGVGAGLGAALGTAMGPLSGGRVGRGAIYGTAIGGGLGLAGAALQKGKEAVLPSGPVNVVLDQPLTVTPQSNFSSPSYGSPSYGSPSGGSNYGNYSGGYAY